MKRELIKAFYLPTWKAYTDEKRIEAVKGIFEYYRMKYKLDYALTFISPKGFESAFANCDWLNKQIFVNPEFIQANSLFCVYNLIHEVRHAIQEQSIKQGKRFKNNKNIIKNFTYYFLYNGEAVMFDNKYDTVFTYKIKKDEQFCLELYLSNPIEKDANEFATKEFKKYLEINKKSYGTDGEANEDFKKTVGFFNSKFVIFSPENENKLFNLCCSLVELAYQENKESITESCFIEKEQRIYDKIHSIQAGKTIKI